MPPTLDGVGAFHGTPPRRGIWVEEGRVEAVVGATLALALPKDTPAQTAGAGSGRCARPPHLQGTQHEAGIARRPGRLCARTCPHPSLSPGSCSNSRI